MAGPTLFLSYNGTDRPEIRKIRERLEAAGIHTFMDEHDLAPGLPWLDRIEAGIKNADGVAVFLGPSGESPWQIREKALALDLQARARRGNKEFPVIPILLPGYVDREPTFLSQNTWVDLRKNLQESAMIEHLSLALGGGKPTDRKSGDIPCPFRGLEPFREGDAPFFFGREADISRLLEQVQKHRLVAVVGPSGSGKSSIVQAGLIPRLRLQREPLWEILTFRPEHKPYRNLARVLYPLLEPEAREVHRLEEIPRLEGTLQTDPEALVDTVDRVLEKLGSTRLLLVLDQLEELLTDGRHPRESTDRAKTFVERLLSARTETSLNLVFTLRADFYGRALDLSRELSDQVEGRQINIGPMSRDERRSAIEGPAKRVGLDFQPGLVDRIEEHVESEPGELPILEYALKELWRHREGNLLTAAAYNQIGGVPGAVSGRAEEEFEKLTRQQQEVAPRLFIKMVYVHSSEEGVKYTRKHTPVLDLKADEAQIIDAFVRERLLVISSESGTVTLAHEALLKKWTRLRGWLQDDLELVLWRQRTDELCREWIASGHRDDYLVREARLTEAEDWLKRRGDELGADLEGFVKTSLAARTRRTRTKLAIVAAVLFIVSALAVVALFGWRHARNEERIAHRERRLALARQLTAQSALARSERPDGIGESLFLGIEALRRFQDLGMVSVEADQVVRRDLALLAPPTAPPLDTGDAVLSMALDKNGKDLITANKEGKKVVVHSWKIAPGRLVSSNLWQDDEPMTAFALSPDGRAVAVAGEDGTVRVLEIRTAGEVARLQHEDEVSAVAFDPGGQHLATASLDGTVHVWDIASGREQANLSHDSDVSAIAINPGGGRLAMASPDGTVVLRDRQTKQEIARLRHDGPVNAIAFRPDGRFLATASHDKTARLWNVENSREISRLPHAGIVSAIAFSGDGRTLATGLLDGTASVWRTLDGSRLGPLVHSDWVMDVAFNPMNGSLLTAVTDGAVHLWSPSDRGSSEEGWTSVWELPRTEGALSAAVSTDGRWIAIGGRQGTARIWDAATRRQVASLRHDQEAAGREPVSAAENGIRALAFHPDGQRVATASDDHTVRIWSVTTGEELARIGHSKAVYDVAFGREGRLLATACDDGVLRLWDVGTGQPAQPLLEVPGKRAVAFSPDGELLAVAGADKSIRLWSVSADRRLTNQRVLSARAHEKDINALAFSPRGTYLGSGSEDHTAKLWTVATGELVSQMSHEDTIHALAFSPDGRYLATASEDRTVRFWPVSLEDLLTEACAHLSIRLTSEGWRRYFGEEPFRETCPPR